MKEEDILLSALKVDQQEHVLHSDKRAARKVTAMDTVNQTARKAACEVQEMAALKKRIDQRLASLNAPEADQALNEFMDEPIALMGKLNAGTAVE